MDKTFLSWKRIWKCHLQNGAIYWWLFFISGMGTLEGQHPKKSWQEFSSKFWTVYKVLYWFLPLACWVFENCLHHNLIKQHFVFEIDILWMKWVKIFIVFTRYLILSFSPFSGRLDFLAGSPGCQLLRVTVSSQSDLCGFCHSLLEYIPVLHETQSEYSRVPL